VTCVTCNAKSLAAVALVSVTHALTAFRTEADYLVLYSFGRLLVGRPCVVGWAAADYPFGADFFFLILAHPVYKM